MHGLGGTNRAVEWGEPEGEGRGQGQRAIPLRLHPASTPHHALSRPPTLTYLQATSRGNRPSTKEPVTRHGVFQPSTCAQSYTKSLQRLES